MEMRGIDPRTSRMLSERSTIWATSPSNRSIMNLHSSNHSNSEVGLLECYITPSDTEARTEITNHKNAETSVATSSVFLSSSLQCLLLRNTFSSFAFYDTFVFLFIVPNPKQFFRRTRRGHCNPVHFSTLRYRLNRSLRPLQSTW